MAGPVAYITDRIKRRQSGDQDFLKTAADLGFDRLGAYNISSSYYGGQHKVRLTERERKFLQASGLPFAENFCETIVDTMVSRLRVRGFGSEDKTFAKFIKDLWRENRLGGGRMVHADAVKLGDSFVIVEPGSPGKKPRICVNPPGQVRVVYDSGEPLYAVKLWTTSRVSRSNPKGAAIRRLNIYWPDEVQKFFSASKDGDWAPFIEEYDGQATSSITWTMDGTPSGEPIGIPVVHFAHKPNQHYGVSKLRGVIPQQDALNKSIIDLFWVMDAQGWPQQWAKGIKNEELTRHPGSLWTVESEDAEFGQFPPADPSNSIEAIESQIKRMASRSSTPLHLMLAGGNLPSGETLKTSESGLTHACRDFQDDSGPQWEDVNYLSARIDTAFGESDFSEDVICETWWEQAESRQETVEAEAAVIYDSLGVSRQTNLSRLGFDPEEEKRLRQAEQADVGAQTGAADLLGKARDMQSRLASDSGRPQPADVPPGGQPPGQ
jgi:hypothetical protein